MNDTFAGLKTDNGVVVLDANFKWQSDNQELSALADMIVPPTYSSSDGDPVPFLLNKLQEKLGGEVLIRQNWRGEQYGQPAGDQVANEFKESDHPRVKGEFADKGAAGHSGDVAQSVDHTVNRMHGLMGKFREAFLSQGSTPPEEVEAHLSHLHTHTGPELYHIAKALNAHATLSEKTPKAKIIKQVSEMIRRTWKTSESVNH